MLSRGKGDDDARLRAEWSRQLQQHGAVELTAGRRVIARVDAEGVRLPARGLLVPWAHLGFADGFEGAGSSGLPSTLSLTVSRTGWAAHIASSTGKERRRATRELEDGWATPTVRFKSWKDSRVEAFGEWLSGEVVERAPLPERFCLSPGKPGPLSDRDTNRPVPLERLPISEELRTRLVIWSDAAEDVPAAQRADEATWERFWPEGRVLAADLTRETGRQAAVWADCPDVP